MGRGGSKQSSPPPPPPPCFSEPWRPMPTSTLENLNFFKSYKPQNKDLKHFRILLHGPAGAGKSSFVNSVESALRGHVTTRAPVDAKGGHSFTLDYKTYKIGNDSQSFYSFVFNDIMGFEKKLENGVQMQDVRLALRGHVKDGYKFNPNQPLTESGLGYNPNPSLEDKVHVLVCVIPVDVIPVLNDREVEKLKAVRRTASDLGKSRF